MKSQITFTKKDIAVTLGCLIFLLANLGAIGAGGRRRAKEAVCLSNLRKWGVCFQLYANDNEGYFMRGWTPSGTRHTDYWMEALRQYYINPDLRCCPEAAIPGTELGLGAYGGYGTFVAWGAFWGDECGEPSPSWPPSTACDYGSYGMNGHCYNPPPGPDFQGHKNEWNWRTPNVAGADNIPLFMDCQFVDGWPLHTNNPPDYDGQVWDNIDQMNRFCINRHSGYVNSAFLDFSARRVGLKELWTLKWHREYQTDGPWTICGGVMPSDWPYWMRDFEDY
jgi:prepilin-type processing-associated H-X9-DG protein